MRLKVKRVRRHIQRDQCGQVDFSALTKLQLPSFEINLNVKMARFRPEFKCLIAEIAVWRSSLLDDETDDTKTSPTDLPKRPLESSKLV